MSSSATIVLNNANMVGDSKDPETPYHKIGFGQCGLVCTQPNRHSVVKIAGPYFHDGLAEDHLCHLRLLDALSYHGDSMSTCRIPSVLTYIDKADNDWWATNQPLLPPDPKFPFPSMALITERIPPLPNTIRHALIERYCPRNLQEKAMTLLANKDCLARIYLGRRHRPGAPLPPNFTLRNFNFCLDQMIECGLPVEEYAKTMGQCLAIMHWGARMDGYDVEFVLGGERQPEATRQPEASPMASQSLGVFGQLEHRVCMWVLDFNLCNRLVKDDDAFLLENEEAVIAQLVLGFFENDPYYPLPMMEEGSVDEKLWSVFRGEYEQKAAVILRESSCLQHLPSKFMDACVQREQQSLQQGLGHGHRQYKG
ncbi:hypothetical protein B0T21DRAFT_411772 [Apiosordaria backusii]|uniref:DUF3669 domain-containing protein n=1 Tax=Apiosordaria backusii TaxID=314023 RepID=A0AA40EFM3_9PEZI|nr:hypothetical protein B0T21DRAFT_411772 [Apiosordaria backusii]